MTQADSTAQPTHDTPLRARHEALGARLIEFAGWWMPVQYSGILDEHRAVRERVGLFDLSHMGELWVEGPDAGTALAGAVVSDPTRLSVGRAQYSMICAPDGGVIDDLIIYRLAEDRFMVVANASNAAAVSDALATRFARTKAVLDDHSLATGLVAVQGPRSREVLAALTDLDLDALRYYAIADGQVAGIPAQVARTGYTGEDGFEIFVDWGSTGAVWDALLERVRAADGRPVGLGARDTLRLEAAMPLYGNELDRSTTPFDIGLGRVVKLDGDRAFVGREALEKIAAGGPARRLVGLVVEGRGIARHGHAVYAGDRRIGIVTSGTQSPTLGQPIAMASVQADAPVEPDALVEIEIRDVRVPARVVPLPFYRRSS